LRGGSLPISGKLGQPLICYYCGNDYKPLFTVLTAVNGSCTGGHAGCVVTLNDNAGTTLPFANPGAFFVPQVTYVTGQSLGVPVVQLGSDAQSVKQNFRFINNTIRSISGNR
jgi:hypothetical protein